MQNISQKIAGAEHLSEVIAFLKNADKFIRLGDIDRALDEIMRARDKNPTIMYTRAYEEYVRTVLLKQTETNGRGSDADTKQTVIHQLMPTLERILDLAIKEVKRSAISAYKLKEVMALQRKTSETQVQEDRLRSVSMTKKISEYLKRAREMELHGDFHNALNEIARAFILDPTDERIQQIEDDVKRAMAAHNKKLEEERQKNQQAEDNRREQLTKQWGELREKEKIAEAEKKEEAYKQARAQKIREYMHAARTMFAQNKLEEAQGQLAFLMVLDPLNEDVLSLNWKIREAEAKQNEERLAKKKQAREQEKKREESIRLAVRNNLKKAETYRRQQRYSEALRIITQAYYIDPANEEILSLEKEIMKEEEEAMRTEDEARRRREEEHRQRQEAELHRLAIEQQKRAQMRERLEAESKLLRSEEEVLLFLSKARGYYRQGNYDEALIQIAKAYKINPFDDDINSLQKDILEAQKKARLMKKAAMQIVVEPEPEQDKATLRAIERHIEKAKKFSSKGKFQEAMDEIAEGFKYDPMNEALFALEGEIQQEYLKLEEILMREEEAARKDQGIKKSLAMAREALSRQSYAEAFGWVDYAMSFDMQRSETMEMRDEIDQAQRKAAEQKANEEKELVIQIHLSKAMELFTENQIEEAMFEVDLSLRLNPGHKGALAMKKKLEKKK